MHAHPRDDDDLHTHLHPEVKGVEEEEGLQQLEVEAQEVQGEEVEAGMDPQLTWRVALYLEVPLRALRDVPEMESLQKKRWNIIDEILKSAMQ